MRLKQSLDENSLKLICNKWIWIRFFKNPAQTLNNIKNIKLFHMAEYRSIYKLKPVILPRNDTYTK